jgi:coproporphyrinogen III oxidase-like Fe-S oxidoreductase
MNWDVIGVAVAVVGLFIAIVQTWISLRQYLESKNLPVVTDKDELRILRALITETEGRGLEIYKSSSFYHPALNSLKERGLIRHKGDKYYLTETGEAVVRKHLADFFKTRRFR